MTLAELFDKHKLNTNEFARKVDMMPGTFRNKLHGRLRSKFTAKELVGIYEQLDNIRKEISNFIKSV